MAFLPSKEDKTKDDEEEQRKFNFVQWDMRCLIFLRDVYVFVDIQVPCVD